MLWIFYTVLFGLLQASPSAAADCSKQANKDILADNLKQVSGQPESNCCSVCALTPGCKGYAWNDYSGGTCWLKAASGPLGAKSGVSVGILNSGGQECQKHSNKDIGAPNLKQVSGKPEGECCSVCGSTPGCLGYAWNGYSGGTCWLKSSTGPLIDKTGVSAGVMSNGGGGDTGGQWKVLQEYAFNNMDQVKSDWDIAIWNPGRVNNELQSYTNSPDNLFVKDGQLVIKAWKRGDKITSARLHSKRRFNPVNMAGKKLRVEFTGTVPTTKGAWPAYWILGDEGKYGDWPTEGEIDVMEWVHQIGDSSKASLHWKGPTDWGVDFSLPRNAMTTQFYTYGVEYSAVPNNEYVQFYVRKPDGNTVYGQRATPAVWSPTFAPCQGQTRPGASKCSPLAPFDNDMYLIMNLAVGGDWGGCCGVNGDYSGFNNGVEMRVKGVKVLEAV